MWGCTLSKQSHDRIQAARYGNDSQSKNCKAMQSQSTNTSQQCLIIRLVEPQDETAVGSLVWERIISSSSCKRQLVKCLDSAVSKCTPFVAAWPPHGSHSRGRRSAESPIVSTPNSCWVLWIRVAFSLLPLLLQQEKMGLHRSHLTGLSEWHLISCLHPRSLPTGSQSLKPAVCANLRYCLATVPAQDRYMCSNQGQYDANLVWGHHIQNIGIFRHGLHGASPEAVNLSQSNECWKGFSQVITVFTLLAIHTTSSVEIYADAHSQPVSFACWNRFASSGNCFWMSSELKMGLAIHILCIWMLHSSSCELHAGDRFKANVWLSFANLW